MDDHGTPFSSRQKLRHEHWGIGLGKAAWPLATEKGIYENGAGREKNDLRTKGTILKEEEDKGKVLLPKERKRT